MVKLKIRENRILEKNRQGKKALGLGLSFPVFQAVELVGLLAQFDYIYLDGEHGTFSSESIADLCRVADGYDLTVVARVPNLEKSTINIFLDQGVMGIVAPKVNTPEQARTLVSVCRFEPEGNRDWSSYSRGNFYNDHDFFLKVGSSDMDLNAARKKFITQLNQETLIIAQLESKTAFENLDAILQVEGIYAFMGGIGDLALSMGYPGQQDSPIVKKAMKDMKDRVHAAGRKIMSDVMEHTMLSALILDGARKFVTEHCDHPK